MEIRTGDGGVTLSSFSPCSRLPPSSLLPGAGRQHGGLLSASQNRQLLSVISGLGLYLNKRYRTKNRKQGFQYQMASGSVTGAESTAGQGITHGPWRWERGTPWMLAAGYVPRKGWCRRTAGVTEGTRALGLSLRAGQWRFY